MLHPKRTAGQGKLPLRAHRRDGKWGRGGCQAHTCGVCRAEARAKIEQTTSRWTASCRRAGAMVNLSAPFTGRAELKLLRLWAL